MYTSLLLWLACTLASAAALRFFLRLRPWFLGASGTAETSMFGKEDLEGEVGLVACEMRSAPGIGRSQGPDVHRTFFLLSFVTSPRAVSRSMPRALTSSLAMAMRCLPPAATSELPEAC